MTSKDGNTRPFAHTAAGHEGITTDPSGSMIIKPCTQAEIDFYESAATDPRHAAFYAHMPTYMGAVRLAPEEKQEDLKSALGGEGVGSLEVKDVMPAQGEGKKEKLEKLTTEWTPSGGKQLSTGLAISLENAAAGITCPCVLDVKLGARLWDDDSPVAKRQKLDDVAKSSTSGSLGFRIAGMKVWVAEDVSEEIKDPEQKDTKVADGYKTYDKFYGREFNENNVGHAFVSYLGGTDGKGKLRRKYAGMLAKRFLRELESLVYVLENEESRMYSASVLMVYEGDEAALERAMQQEEEDQKDFMNGDMEDEYEDEDEVPPKVMAFRIIDFAHARWTPGEGPDQNALQGVRSLTQLWKDIVDEQ